MAVPKYPSNPVLFVDDEEDILQSYKMSLRMNRINNIELCSDSRLVARLLGERQFSVAVLDLSMPHVSGMQLLELIHTSYPDLPVIVATGMNDVTSAVTCMKMGAYDYLVKPIDESKLISAINNTQELSALRSENEALRNQMLQSGLKHPEAFDHIITNSPAMKSIFSYIEAISFSMRPILICGESGTGKELFARAVHNASGREGEFVPVNVGGLDDNVFSDTLFGHRKGAFTGADTNRQGLVERASKGTLFLDEIGTLDHQSQVKLLRLLQERQYYPLGSDTHKSANAAIIAATNEDLSARVKEGTFRTDLYYRLKTHCISIPPLRKRMEDLPLLVEHFGNEAAEAAGRNAVKMPRQALGILAGYSFPGNVRELQSIVFDLVSRACDGVVDIELLKHTLHMETVVTQGEISAPQAGQPMIYYLGEFPTLDAVERFFIEKALRLSNNNQSAAARMLGVSQSMLSRRVGKNSE
ncbi:MAG: response regulator [Chitinivibrionales bacterium]|nr:response regulator [Chitinivibrionales bacterium]